MQIRPPGPESDSAFTRIGGGQPLQRSRFVLRWSSLGADARYSLVVATRDLAPLHAASGLARTEHQVPEAALAPLAAGTEVVWTVEAVLPDGRRIEPVAFLAKLE